MLSAKHSKYRRKPLLEVPIKLERYADLTSSENFDVATLQRHLFKSGPSQWALNSRTGVKSNLEVHSHCMFMSNVSWWPYRLVRQIGMSQFHKLITFYSTTDNRQCCAFGIEDKDLFNKAFVIVSLRKAKHVQRLIAALESIPYLSAGKLDLASAPSPTEQEIIGDEVTEDSIFDQITDMDDEIEVQANPATVVGSTQTRRRSSTSLVATDSRSRVTQASASCQVIATNGHVINPSLKRTRPPPSSEVKSITRGSSPIPNTTPRLMDDPHQYDRLPPYREHITPIKSATSQQAMAAPPASCSSSSTLKVRGKSFISGPPPPIAPPPTQTTARRRDDTEPRWLEDVQYIRYDPKLGNVLCDEGPVYMYSSRPVN